jgi:D-tyrosyl-tRNA(Tyr) deacylase
MRAVVQRVTQARVSVAGDTVGAIDAGLVVLLGVEHGDGVVDADYLADKIAHLRIFEDSDGKMNVSLQDAGGSALVVSQFTLLGDARHGRRPSFTAAAPPECAQPLYERFCAGLASHGVPVARGVFQATMAVALVNDGPVTLLLDSRKAF